MIQKEVQVSLCVYYTMGTRGEYKREGENVSIGATRQTVERPRRSEGSYDDDERILIKLFLLQHAAQLVYTTAHCCCCCRLRSPHHQYDENEKAKSCCCCCCWAVSPICVWWQVWLKCWARISTTTEKDQDKKKKEKKDGAIRRDRSDEYKNETKKGQTFNHEPSTVIPNRVDSIGWPEKNKNKSHQTRCSATVESIIIGW